MASVRGNTKRKLAARKSVPCSGHLHVEGRILWGLASDCTREYSLMSTSNADQAYADYMLHWVQTLEWPSLPVAEQALPQIQAWWRDRAATDLVAVADSLWAWVDANGGQARSSNKRMILARMLICLVNPENRELQQRGYFEELLDLYGVATEDILRVMEERGLVSGADADAPQFPDSESVVSDGQAARAGHLQRLKTQVLAAFFALSFVSGARPLNTPSAPTIETLLIFSMALLIFLWYRFDSDQRGYPRTPMLNFAMIMVAAIAMPYYLIRSRGPEQGPRSVWRAFAVFLGSVLLSMIGMSLFNAPA